VELSDSLVVMRGYAYRTPEDTRPGIGHSQMPIPGKTPYTKDSEVENAETSAWGRAIAALGFEVHNSIASAEEVAMKAGDPTSAVAGRASSSGTPAATTGVSAARKNRWLKDARTVFATDEEIAAFAQEITKKDSSKEWDEDDMIILADALLSEKLDRIEALASEAAGGE
jgi:hypothetical protein